MLTHLQYESSRSKFGNESLTAVSYGSYAAKTKYLKTELCIEIRVTKDDHVTPGLLAERNEGGSLRESHSTRCSVPLCVDCQKSVENLVVYWHNKNFGTKQQQAATSFLS